MRPTAGTERGGRLAPARRSGFSLLELAAVLAIIAIVLGMAAPSFQAMIENQRIQAAANDLYTSINLARSEALQRGRRVDLVPAGAGTDWSKGWVVFVDMNGNRKPDSGDRIIFTHGPVANGIRITARFTDSTVQYLAYAASGRTRTNASGYTPQLGSFSIALGNQTRRITVNFLGRARTCNPARERVGC